MSNHIGHQHIEPQMCDRTDAGALISFNVNSKTGRLPLYTLHRNHNEP